MLTLFFLLCVPWYRTIYNMCTQKPPHDFSQQLYERYREAFNEYITSKVRAAGMSQALKHTCA